MGGAFAPVAPSLPTGLLNGVGGAYSVYTIMTWQQRDWIRWLFAHLPIAFKWGGIRELRDWTTAINNAMTLNISHEKLFTFLEDLWSPCSAKKIDQNYFWLKFGLQLVSEYHRSLSLILCLDVTVRILPRKDVFCRDFILCAVATFWAMSLVGIYPGMASSFEMDLVQGNPIKSLCLRKPGKIEKSWKKGVSWSQPYFCWLLSLPNA